jgi:hypothetical protein
VRRLALATTGVAVAVMAGCATAPPVPQWKDPGPEPASPAVTTAVAAPVRSAQPPPPSPETRATSSGTPGPSAMPSGERFLAAVRGQLPEMAMDLRNEEITEMGGQACDSLAAGTARRSVAAELSEYGVPAADARKLVALARSTLCHY